jgi:hypothetical protein
MFTLQFYNFIHLVGIFGLLMALAAICYHAANRGEKRSATARKGLLALHGVSSFLILLAGFGMLARLDMATGWPLWVWGKLVIWVALSFGVVLPYRKERWAMGLLFGAWALAITAALLVYWRYPWTMG